MNRDRHQKNPQCLLGFSLLELMVVVVLLGGLMALVTPAIQALVGLDLKGEITKIGGLSNEVYSLAAISGKNHRIVFDIENNQYWVEEQVGDAGEIKPDLSYEELMEQRIKKGLDRKEDEAANAFLPSFKEVEGPLGEKTTLPKDIVLFGVWAEGMKEVSRVGQVFIRFYTGGYAQASFVSLAIKGDEDNTAMYVSLDPLTAQITIKQGEPDIKDLRPEESEK
jgi:prepilin-type N-terminal cleavage/methylation domain-containing protein